MSQSLGMAMIEMQRCIGELSAKVDRLISDTGKQGEKIDSVRIKIAWVTGAAAVVGVLLGATLTILSKMPWASMAP